MRAKDIIVKPIRASVARKLIRAGHYSGKVVNNSQIHFGAFIGARLGGALSFGPPLDRSKVLGLVSGSTWNSVIELNRMYLADWLPRNSESRVISVCCRLFKKHRPEVEWVLSYADATQCGDGTIYRASGFKLTGLKRSKNLARLPDGSVVHKMTLESAVTRPRKELGGRSYFQVTGGKYDFRTYCKIAGAEVLEGYQYRYIRFLDPTQEGRLTVPVIPIQSVPKEARMYLGVRG